MYTEYEEKKGFPIRDFLIKLVLIIIFVLLLLWLLPIPNMEGINNSIFNANVQTMKDAAINYFTTERLPQKVGDKVTLTLQEMLDLKLLLPFTDKNGDTCDVKNSYVTLEKLETEYQMTVHLKCKGQEDEIVVYLGCYSYCTTDICEKKEEEEPTPSTPEQPTKPGQQSQPQPQTQPKGPSCSLTVSSGKAGENGWYLGDVVVKFKSKTTNATGAKITNYGIGTSSNYDGKDTYTVTKDGVTTVYGYVKDSNGKTAVCSIDVKKDAVAPTCGLTVLSGSTAANGSYVSDVTIGFSSKTDVTSGVKSFGLDINSKPNYNNKSTYIVGKDGTTKVYGFVKDAAGNTKTCDITVTKKTPTSTNSKPSCGLQVTSGTMGLNNWYVSNVNIGFKSKTSTNGATITSFGIGPTTTYNNNSSYTVNSDGNFVIKGYVKDSNGNTATCSIEIKRDATRPNCELTVLSGTKNNSGNYISDVVVGFKSKTDATSGVGAYGISVGNNPTYNSTDKLTITNNGTHNVIGYVKDKAGNTSTCNTKITKVALTYEYEYAKQIAAAYSNWGEWQTKEYNPSNPPKWGLSSDGLSETEDLGKTTVKKYEVGNARYVDRIVESDSVAVKTCAGYNYYRKQSNTTTTYAIQVSDGWKFDSYVTLDSSVVPSDTVRFKYELVNIESDECNGKCTTEPGKILWKRYSRNVYTVTAEDTLTSTSGVTVKCSSYENRPLKVYNTFRTIAGYDKKLVETTVYTYRIRYRSLISAAYTDIKWSSYNDLSLINAGYKMTGNYRLVN